MKERILETAYEVGKNWTTTSPAMQGVAADCLEELRREPLTFETVRRAIYAGLGIGIAATQRAAEKAQDIMADAISAAVAQTIEDMTDDSGDSWDAPTSDYYN